MKIIYSLLEIKLSLWMTIAIGLELEIWGLSKICVNGRQVEFESYYLNFISLVFRFGISYNLLLIQYLLLLLYIF